MNPFDLPGPEFLQLYAIVLIVAVIVAYLARWLLRLPGGAAPAPAFDLTPYEVAYLSGGAALAIDAAVVRLVQLGVLFLDVGARRLSQRSVVALPARAHPLEQAVHRAAAEDIGTKVEKVRDETTAVADELREPLDELGLLIPRERVGLVRLVPGLVVLAATLFGVIKIFVGMSRDRPVLYLFLLVMVSIVPVVLFFANGSFRSRRGDAALRQWKHENAALEYASRRRGDELADNDLLLAMGLFGIGVLAGGPLAPLPNALAAPTRASSSGSSCSGSSCGGAVAAAAVAAAVEDAADDQANSTAGTWHRLAAGIGARHRPPPRSRLCRGDGGRF